MQQALAGLRLHDHAMHERRAESAAGHGSVDHPGHAAACAQRIDMRAGPDRRGGGFVEQHQTHAAAHPGACETDRQRA